MGSATQITVGVDYHALTVIEADSTLTQPVKVANVTLGVAQRYSVLLTTNQHAEPQGNYWLRAAFASAVPVNGTNGVQPHEEKVPHTPLDAEDDVDDGEEDGVPEAGAGGACPATYRSSSRLTHSRGQQKEEEEKEAEEEEGYRAAE